MPGDGERHQCQQCFGVDPDDCHNNLSTGALVRRLAKRTAERDAARATAASLEAELAALRTWLNAKSDEASRESDYGMNIGPLHRMKTLDMVLAFMDEYPHERGEGESGE